MTAVLLRLSASIPPAPCIVNPLISFDFLAAAAHAIEIWLYVCFAESQAQPIFSLFSEN
jgi:hypothetical protein